MKRSKLWFKVKHPWFDPHMAYEALWYHLHSESAWGYLLFAVPTGHCYAIQVRKCTLLRKSCDIPPCPSDPWRPLTETEELQPWAEKPRVMNPELHLDIYDAPT